MKRPRQSLLSIAVAALLPVVVHVQSGDGWQHRSTEPGLAFRNAVAPIDAPSPSLSGLVSQLAGRRRGHSAPVDRSPVDTAWIGRPTVRDSAFCRDETFSVTFDAGGDFDRNNIFIIELFDTARPTVVFDLGSYLATTGGTYDAYVGQLTASSGTYRIRIVSTIPHVVSEPNDRDIRVFDRFEAEVDPLRAHICGENDSLELRVIVRPAAAEIGSIRWSTGDTTRSIFVHAAGEYSAVVSDADGCAAPTSISLVSAGNPPVPIVEASDTVLCEGDSLTLTVASNGHQYFRWSNGAETRSTTIYKPGRYAVEAWTAEGCGAVSDTVTIAGAARPPVPDVERNGTVLRTDATAFEYQWYRNGEPIPGATGAVLPGVSDGFYRLVVRNREGCEAVSETIEVSPTGVAEDEIRRREGRELMVVTDPEADGIIVRFPGGPGGTVRVRISDVCGRLVSDEKFGTEGRLQVYCPIDELPSGLYFVRVECDGVSGVAEMIRR